MNFFKMFLRFAVILGICITLAFGLIVADQVKNNNIRKQTYQVNSQMNETSEGISSARDDRSEKIKFLNGNTGRVKDAYNMLTEMGYSIDRDYYYESLMASVSPEEVIEEIEAEYELFKK